MTIVREASLNDGDGFSVSPRFPILPACRYSFVSGENRQIVLACLRYCSI